MEYEKTTNNRVLIVLVGVSCNRTEEYPGVELTRQLNHMDQILRDDEDAYRFLFIKNNQLIFEKYYNGTKLSQQSNIQSITKIAMSTLIGIAIEENYIVSSTHLLSAIITRATGMNAQDYANCRLFEPLGFTANKWVQDPQGNSMGGAQLFLSSNEL